MLAERGEENIYTTEALRSIVDSAITQHTKQVIGDEKRRADTCMGEIQQSLNRHDCVIVPRCVISPNGVEFQIETMPRLHKGEKEFRKEHDVKVPPGVRVLALGEDKPTTGEKKPAMDIQTLPPGV